MSRPIPPVSESAIHRLYRKTYSTPKRSSSVQSVLSEGSGDRPAILAPASLRPATPAPGAMPGRTIRDLHHTRFAGAKMAVRCILVQTGLQERDTCYTQRPGWRTALVCPMPHIASADLSRRDHGRPCKPAVDC